MRRHVLADADALAATAAARIAGAARAAVAARGRFCVAFSGGSSPRRLFQYLVDEQVPWGEVHVFQVDERLAPDGHPDRNATDLRAHLLDHVPIPTPQVHLMPVTAADATRAADEYAAALRAACGTTAVLDLVHLGLGDDGHTASLPPGDAVLGVVDRDVAWTAEAYNGRRRMTLTYPALDRARAVVWLVNGAGKAAMVRRLLAADATIPAGRVRQERAELLGDAAACPGDG